MAEPKTKVTKKSVAAFIAAIADEETRRDCRTLVTIMKRVTGAAPKMWGPSIVGFGLWRYVYASGRTGDWPLAAFSPRKQNLTIYCMLGDADRKEALLQGLGKFKVSKACLYVKRLSDLDRGRLERLIKASVAEARKRYPMP